MMYNRRASRCYRTVKQMVEQGQIGELVRCTWVITDLYRTDAYYTSGSWRGSWQSEGGGILMTQASHQLDLMQWICGMPVSVQARCTTQDRPIKVENEAELFDLSMAHARAFIASAHECPGRNMLEICGTRGRITVENDRALELLLLEQDERNSPERCPSPFEKAPYTVQTWTFDDSDNKVNRQQPYRILYGLPRVVNDAMHISRRIEVIADHPRSISISWKGGKSYYR